jgi:EipB-like
VPDRIGLVVVLGVLLASAGLIGRAPAAPVELASHRAIYNLKLLRASSSAAVNAAAGRLVVEWRDSCDGYTTNQRFLTEFSDPEGQSSTTDLWVSSLEAQDGNVFRFNLTTSSNGRVQERSRGLARRAAGKAGAKADGGEVSFEEPKTERRTLPAGTLFPTSHTVALIQAAKSGANTLERIVFDGGADNGLSYVSAFIGKERISPAVALPPTPVAEKGKGVVLTEGRAWPIRLAFYPYEKAFKTDELPDYEMSFLLHENGVATGLEFDYGDFVIAADLSKIEPLPGCPTRR